MAEAILEKLVLNIERLTCRRKFNCDYCKKQVDSGHKYVKVNSRTNKERFPTIIKVCKAHELSLLPLALFMRRKK